MQKLLVIGSALVLLGCTLPPQQKEDMTYCRDLTGGPVTRDDNDPYWQCLKNQPHAVEQRSRQERREQENVQRALHPHKLICKEAGFIDGTEAFSNCVVASHQNALDAASRANQAGVKGTPDYTRFLQPPSPPKQTKCTFFGNTATCVEQ